ncbi:MAG: hypothetical protein SFV15_20225 [Polyangiaceae bacterium]|nr:hypothetical protein [Polyangiaceae bacterium]
MLRTRLAFVIVGVSLFAAHCNTDGRRSPSRVTIFRSFAGAEGIAGQSQNGLGGAMGAQGGGAGSGGAANGSGGEAGATGAAGSPGDTGGAASGGNPTSAGGSGTGGAFQVTGGSGGVPSGTTGGQGTGTTGGQGTGGSGNAYEVCVATCQQTYCDTQRANCTNATGNAVAGPAAGQPKKNLCGDMIACAEATKCYAGSTGAGESCYCGTADQVGCISGLADGACKMEAEKAAESSVGLTIGQRWVNPGYAMGLSGVFIRCTLKAPVECAKQCSSSGTGGSGPVGGTGGGSSGGSGGTEAGGTGGDLGLGGTEAGGTGGDLGAGGSGATGGSDGLGGGGSGGALGAGGTLGSGGTLSSGGGGGLGGSGGSLGSGGSGGGTPPGTCVGPSSCYVDLNANGKSDCSESVVANSQFLNDIAGWSPGYLSAGAWSASGPNSCTGSVAATVKSGLQQGGVSQCVRVTAGDSYRVRAQYFIEASLTTTDASLTLAAYSNADCSTAGPALPGGTWTSSGSVRGTWTSLRWLSQDTPPVDLMVMPVGAQSLRISLNATRPSSSQPDATVLWDNVLLLKQ